MRGVLVGLVFVLGCSGAGNPDELGLVRDAGVDVVAVDASAPEVGGKVEAGADRAPDLDRDGGGEVFAETGVDGEAFDVLADIAPDLVSDAAEDSEDAASDAAEDADASDADASDAAASDAAASDAAEASDAASDAIEEEKECIPQVTETVEATFPRGVTEGYEVSTPCPAGYQREEVLYCVRKFLNGGVSFLCSVGCTVHADSVYCKGTEGTVLTVTYVCGTSCTVPDI